MKRFVVNMDKNKKLLLELICDRQIALLLQDSTNYESAKYKQLEKLKVYVKDIKEGVAIEGN